jgi:hypothetical protein
LGVGAMATLRESDLKPARFYHLTLQHTWDSLQVPWKS